jgi:hypothetical protein
LFEHDFKDVYKVTAVALTDHFPGENLSDVSLSTDEKRAREERRREVRLR